MKVWFNCSTSLLSLIGKARRKDKDVSSSAGSDESKQYLEATILECVTPEYKLREIVSLPDGVDYNEWLASHTISFFDHINLVYGTISEYCTMSGCPEMSGPSNRQYAWIDEKGKRFKLSAPQYIDFVMTYTQKTVNDESVFPTKFDKEFPSSFESNVKRIIRLLFHVLAHIYHTHFKEIVLLNLHSHLNCIFAHLVLFNDSFKIVDDKEVEVLEDLAVALKLHAYVPCSSTSSTELAQPQMTPSVTPEPSNPASLAIGLDNLQHHPQHALVTSCSASSSSSNVSNSKDNVITEQCRSISPFINNNFKNPGTTSSLQEQNVRGGLDDAGPSFGAFSTRGVTAGGSRENTRARSHQVPFSHDPNDNHTNVQRISGNFVNMSVLYGATGVSGVDNDEAHQQHLRHHQDNLSRRSTSASAILLSSCSSEPSLPSAALAARRSNSSGNGSGGAGNSGSGGGHPGHPYNNYHQVYHRSHSTANRGSACCLDANSPVNRGVASGVSKTGL